MKNRKAYENTLSIILDEPDIKMEEVKVEQVIFDKTGTLTKGNFVLQEIESYQAHEKDELLQIAAAVEMHSTHPIAVSIVAEAKKRGLIAEPAEEIEEIAGHGIRAMLGGQEILFGNEKLMEQRGFSLPESSFGTSASTSLVRLSVSIVSTTSGSSLSTISSR